MPKFPFGSRELGWVPSAGIELSKPTSFFAGAISIRNVHKCALLACECPSTQLGPRLNRFNDPKALAKPKEEAMKRVALATVLLSGLCVLLLMPKSLAQQVVGDQIEPKADSWNTSGFSAVR